MPDLKTILDAQSNLLDLNPEEKVQQRIAGNTVQTQTNRPPSVAGMIQPRQQQQVKPQDDRNLLQNIGKGLWDFGEEFIQQGIDTALLGMPSAGTFTGGNPWFGLSYDTDIDSFAGKAGQAIGGAAGFLVPFAGTSKFITSPLSRVVANATMNAGGKTMQKKALNAIKNASGKPGAVTYADDAIDSVKESKNLSELFDETIAAPFAQSMRGFNKLNPEQKTTFASKIEKGAGEFIKELAETKGIVLSDDAVKSITTEVGEIWMQAGGRPINSLQGLIHRAMGQGKYTGFYSHMFEEGVIFAAVESGMHAVEVNAGNEEAHFGTVAKDAFLLGHAFGLVRFIPGGVEGGMGMNPITKTGRERIAALIKGERAYARRYNVNDSTDRESIAAMYQSYMNIPKTPFKYPGRDLRDEPMEEIMTTIGERMGAGNLTMNGERILNPSPSRILRILQDGTEAEQKAAAKHMQEVLQEIMRTGQSKYRREFLKTMGDDVLKSSFRMAAGGVVMTGPGVLMDDNIPFEEKMLHFAMGAFLMKKGKVLNYREKLPGGELGAYKKHSLMREFPKDLNKIGDFYKTLGVEIVNKDGNIDPLWLKTYLETTKFEKESGGEQQLSFSNPKAIQGLIDLAQSGQPIGKGEIYNHFITDAKKPLKPHKRESTLDKENSFVNERGERQVIIERKVDEAIYESFTRKLNSVLSDKQRFKEWSELSPAEKQMWKDGMDKLEMPTTELQFGQQKLERLFVKANIDSVTNTMEALRNRANEAAEALTIDGKNDLTPLPIELADGSMALEYKKIDIRNADLTAEQAYAIRQYNHLIELLANNGRDRVANANADLYLNTRATNIQGFEKFLNAIDEGLKDMNGVRISENGKRVGLDLIPKDSNGEINWETQDYKTNFSDPWLYRLLSLNKMETLIDYTATHLLKYMDVSNAKYGKSSLGNKLREVFMDDNGFYVATGIKITNSDGSTNVKETQIARLLLETIKLSGATRSEVKKNEVSRSVDEFNELKKRLLGEGFDIYQEKLAINDFDLTKLIRQRTLEYKLANGEMLVDGKPVKITMSEVQKIQEGIDNGLINDNLTFTPIADVLFESLNIKGFQKIFKNIGKEVEILNYEDAFKIIEADTSLSKDKKAQLISLLKQFQKDNPMESVLGIFSDVKFINDTFMSLVRTKENPNGVLHLGDKEFTMMDDANIRLFKEKLYLMKNQAHSEQVNQFIFKLGELANIESKHNKRLINTLIAELQYSQNPLSIYAIAREYGFYKEETKSFKETLPESDANKIIEAIRDRTLRDWSQDDKFLQEDAQRYLESSQKAEKNKSDVKPLRMQELINTYGIADVWKLSPTSEKTQTQYLQDIWRDSYLNKEGKDGQINWAKNATDFVTDLSNSIAKASEGKKKVEEILPAVQKWFNTSIEQRDHVIVRLNYGAPQNSSLSKGVHQNNLAFDRIDKLQTDNKQKAKVIFLDGSINVEGLPKTSTELMSEIKSMFFGGKVQTLPENLASNPLIESSMNLNGKSFFVYKLGNTDASFLIRNSPQNINAIVNNYGKYLKELVDAGIIKQKFMDNILNNSGNASIRYNETTKRYEPVNEQFGGKDIGNERIHEIMNDYILGGIFQKTYWESNMRDARDKEVGDLVKRLPLIANTNAVKYDANKILSVSEVLDKNNIKIDNKAEVVKTLQQLAKGELKEVVYADETIDGTGSVSERFDVLKIIETEYNALIEKAKADPNAPADLIESLTFEKQKLLESAEASSVNGISFVTDNLFAATSYLGGEPNWKEAGGVKPIIVKNVNGHIFVQKTAFLRNSEMKEYFDNNKDVAMVSFTSATKKIGNNLDNIKIIDGQKFESHLEGAESIGVDFLRPITPESINIVSVKSNKTQASLARNNTVHLRGKELDAYYDAIHKQSIDKIFRDIAELKDPYATHQRSALYKMLMNDRKTQASGDFNYAESQSGIETLWAELGGEPSMFPRSWENMIKSEYIDKEIAKKINGGQGVLQADLKNELKNTIVVNGEVFQYGEARIGDVNKNKLINPDRITLIKRNETIKDDLMSLSGNKPFALLHRELKQLRQQELNTLEKTLELFEKFKKDNNLKDYDIAMSAERNPHTKPSSVMVVALKGFTKNGNDVILNHADLKRAAEGDFDIDTANVYWEMPTQVVQGYARGRGKVQDSNVIGIETNDAASYFGVELKNQGSMFEFSRRAKEAEKLRGPLMNMQGVLQHLESHSSMRSTYENSSGVAEKLVIRVGQNTYVTLKSDLTKTHQLIADYVQATLDSNSGYDMNKITYDNTVKEILFGENGAFELKKMSDKISKDTGNKYLRRVVKSKEGDKIEYVDLINNLEAQTVVMKIIDPYRRLLNLSTAIYEGGEARSVGLRELSSGVKNYEYEMKNAEFEAIQYLQKEKNFFIDKKENIFNGWNMNARPSQQTGPNQVIYDKLLRKLSKIKELSLNEKSEGQLDKFGQEINDMTNEERLGSKIFVEQSSEGFTKLNDFVKNQAEAAESLNAIDKKIDEMYAARRLATNKSDRDYYDRKIKELSNKDGTGLKQKIQKRLSEEFTKEKNGKFKGEIAKKMLKRWEQKVTEEILAKKPENERFLTDKDVKNIKQIAKQRLIKNGIIIEGAPKSEVIHALTLQNMFSTYAIDFKSVGLNKIKSKELDKQVELIRDEFNKAVDTIVKSKEGHTWDNLYNHTVDRIAKVIDMNASGKERFAVEQIFMAKIMSPRADITKLISYKGNLYPAPQSKRMDTFVKLGLSYYAKQYKNEPLILNEIYSRLIRFHKQADYKLRGLEAEGLPEGPLARQEFYLEPLTYNGMKKDMLLEVFRGDFQASLAGQTDFKHSRLNAYEQLHKAFGSGLIRDIMTDGTLFTLPDRAVIEAGAHTRDISFGGVAEFQKAMDQGMRSVKFDKDGETYISTDGGVLRVTDSAKIENIGNTNKKPKNVVQDKEQKRIDELLECF